jgi:hypothetical protein
MPLRVVSFAVLCHELCHAASFTRPTVCRTTLHAVARALSHPPSISRSSVLRALSHRAASSTSPVVYRTPLLPCELCPTAPVVCLHVDGGREQELGVHHMGAGHECGMVALEAARLGGVGSPGRGSNGGRSEARGGVETGGIVREGESARERRENMGNSILSDRTLFLDHDGSKYRGIFPILR